MAASLVRRAEPLDLPEVETLLKRADLPALDPHPVLANLLVAEGDTGVVGAVALEVAGRSGLIRAIVVEEDRRGQGVGDELMRSLMARVAELSLKQLYVIASGGADFFSARGFAAAGPEALPAFVREAHRRRASDAPLLQLRLR
jgi:N-acetylglutamate synthase-like GNAT family acetyltransferase